MREIQKNVQTNGIFVLNVARVVQIESLNKE